MIPLYLEFEEYVNMGGKQSEQVFARFLARAEAEVDIATQGRLKAFEEIPSLVKTVVFDLVDYFSIVSSCEDKPVVSRSQSAGGVSESETYGTATTEEKQAGIKSLLYPLQSLHTANGVNVMYRGVAE